MIDNNDLFDEYLSSQIDDPSKRYIIKEDESYLYMILAMSRGFATGLSSVANFKKPFPAPIINFNDVDDVDSFASFYKGNYFVGLNIGIVKLLRFYFGYIMSDPLTLPFLGQSSLETLTYDKLPYINYYHYDELMAYWGDRTIPYPKCPIRQLFVDFLLLEAVYFIFAHELSHTLAGDAEFRVQSPKMFGKRYLTDLEVSLLRDQTSEMYCDMLAVSISLGGLKGYFKNELELKTDRFKLFYQNEVDALYFTSMAIFGSFLFMKEEDDTDLNVILDYDHPPITARALYIKEFFWEEFDAVSQKKMPIIYAVRNAIKEIERGFDKMSDTSSPSVLENSNIDLFRDYSQLLQNTWNDASELLKPYALIDLPKFVKF